MDNTEEIAKDGCDVSQEQPIPFENNFQPVKNLLPENIINQNSNSENQSSVEITDACSEATKVNSECNSTVSKEISLPPLPKDDKGQQIQSSASYSADYNPQNYNNYNYMYNYNNYYGYPYPQYQWDYTSQQYYQPYQNYYNYNFNANQVQTSKPPPPPPDTVQLPVEEKPANKANITIDDSNRYSPTAETDDDDTLKGSSGNNVSNVIEHPTQVDTSSTNSTQFPTMLSEQIEIQQNVSENVDYKLQQPITLVQQSVLPVSSELQSYNIPVQQPSYLNNSQIQMQSVEASNELLNQQKNSIALNGKEGSVEKVSKNSTVLGKNQAKKRLMAFSMMKQKIQEQNNSTNDNQNSDIGEGIDVEFVPELNVFQTVTKKKVVTNKKVTKVIKAQQTIEQIEEMKKDELLQGNNAALYQHLLRSGGNEAPILQKLGIESLAERYSAKIREQDKRLKRHHHSRRDDRRSHKHRRRSHSKSRSRSKSTDKPKMRALEVQSWKDFVAGGFHFDKFRRFKVDEAEEMKDKERKSRPKKRHGDSRSEGKKQNTESIILTDVEKGNSNQKLRYNLLYRKKEILKSFEVTTRDGDYTKDFPSYIIQHTKTKPVLKYSENPAKATCHLQNRQQMLSTLLPEIEVIVHRFLSSMKPKKVKENPIDVNYDYIDDKILVMMKDINIYPFKGWWPKKCFIVTHVKEDPNIEIDKDALLNEFPVSKRTKKSRFNDQSLIDLRPTVPSKWDSDYDGSPATDKVTDVEVPQNLVASTNNIKETNPPIVDHQFGAKDTSLGGIGKSEPNIEINEFPILPIQSQEPQGYAKLDNEYEEFLKIVSAEKMHEKVDKDVLDITYQKENENNISKKSVVLYDESVHDESEEDTSTKSSNESIKIDSPFVKSLTPIDITLKNQKKSKKSKKLKKKENKKKKCKSSSSDSSQDSDSESDSSSSEDHESDGTTDTISTIEKKKRKKKSNDKKKNKKRKNYKKKKNNKKKKIIEPEDEKDDKNSILNLLEKALNVEIKEKPMNSEESKQKKNKRKHGKKDTKSNDDEYKLEKVKECLKETFTKLVKTDKVACNTNAVNEVLKYLKIDEEKGKKHKKSKKNSKRKYDSDVSDYEVAQKKSKLDNSLILENVEIEKKKKKKKKKSIDSDEPILKKSKKKSKSTDTSETEDGLEVKQNIINEDDDSHNFFGMRPNDWSSNNKSSMREVTHHSNIKNKNASLSINDDKSDQKEVGNFENDKILNNFSHCEDVLENNDNALQTTLKMINNKKQDLNEDFNNIIKPTQSKIIDQYDNTISSLIKPSIYGDTISYRDKVKMNLKKLSTSQHMPFVFGFTSPLNLMKLNKFKLEKKEKTIELTKETKQKVDELEHLIFNKPKLAVSSQIPNDVTNEILPKINININNKVIDQSSIWEDSEESDSGHLSMRSNNTCEHLSDELESDQMKSKLLNNNSLKKDDKKLQNKILSNDIEVKELKQFNLTEKYESDSNIKEQRLDSEENLSNLSNSIYLSKPEHFMSNVMVSQNDTQALFMTPLKKKESDFVYSTNLNFDDSEVFKIDNELITQWIYDWNKLDKSITEINNLNNNYFNDINKLQTKRKSRWNKQSPDDSIDDLQNFINEQGERQSRLDNYTNLKNTSFPINIDDTSENQNLIYNEGYNDMSVNNDYAHSETCPNEYDYSQSYYQSETYETYSNNYDDYSQSYSENCHNEYEDYSQSYDQYSHEPIYSNKNIDEDDQLNSVDYNIYYENYNTTSDFHHDYDVGDFKDTSHQSISEASSLIQVGNEMEMLHSEDILNVENGLTSENIVSIISDAQGETVNVKDATCDEQFFQLYQQYFQHYNQNPIKYSLNDPVLDNILEVNINTLKKSPSYEDLDTDLECDKIISIPLRARGYSRLIEDNNTCVYITSDNYLAYCAIEDKCMVHVAVDPCNYDGIEEKVRHCFNLNENGTIAEYWLHADLIPFNTPKDSELGVFSNEDDSVVSDSSQDDIDNDVDDNGDKADNDSNNDDYDLINKDYEIVDSSSENDRSWMEDPRVINKYGGVEQIVMNQEGNMSNSPEYDYDYSESESEDYNVTTFSNEKNNVSVNNSQILFKPEDKENKSQYIIDDNQTENTTSKCDLHIENNNFDQLVLVTESKVANSELLNETQNSILKSQHEKTKFDNKLKSNVDVDIISVVNTKNNGREKLGCVSDKEMIAIEELRKINCIIKQKLLIQRLKRSTKEKSFEKQPDTAMICYSDNMETVKHPFLGLFQPPTISILSKPSTFKISKHVTFADGINPGENLAESPTCDNGDRPFSPPPLKALIREALKLKRNMYPLKKSKVRTKLKMVDKKIAKVTPVIKDTNSSAIEYYISRHRVEVQPNIRTTDWPISNNDHNKSRKITLPRNTREVTPVPSDNECWDNGSYDIVDDDGNDDDSNTKDNTNFRL